MHIPILNHPQRLDPPPHITFLPNLSVVAALVDTLPMLLVVYQILPSRSVDCVHRLVQYHGKDERAPVSKGSRHSSCTPGTPGSQHNPHSATLPVLVGFVLSSCFPYPIVQASLLSERELLLVSMPLASVTLIHYQRLYVCPTRNHTYSHPAPSWSRTH